MSTSTATFETAEKSLMAASLEVFRTMLGGALAKAPDGTDPGETQVSSIVGFGGKFSGFVALHMSRDVACQISGAMLGGMEITEVDEMVHDALGEVGNMVAGGFKKILSEDLGETAFQISLPTVVEGAGITTQGPHHAMSSKGTMTTSDYKLALQLVLEESG